MLEDQIFNLLSLEPPSAFDEQPLITKGAPDTSRSKKRKIFIDNQPTIVYAKTKKKLNSAINKLENRDEINKKYKKNRHNSVEIY